MSCDYPKCNCPRDPDLAVQECWEKFCTWWCKNPHDKKLKKGFFEDWWAQRAKQARKGRKTVPKEFLKYLHS